VPRATIPHPGLREEWSKRPASYAGEGSTDWRARRGMGRRGRDLPVLLRSGVVAVVSTAAPGRLQGRMSTPTVESSPATRASAERQVAELSVRADSRLTS